MDEYKRRRRRSRAVMSMFLDSLGGVIDNVDVATFDSDGNDLKALVVGIELVQSGTGDPSPDNVRPITGHSSVNVIVSPTLNPLDGTITNIPLGTTVYGGTLDVLTGVLVVDKAMVDLGTLSFNKYGADPIYYTPIPNKANGITNILSDKFFLDAVAIASMASGGMRGYSSSAVVYFRRNDCPTLADWNTWLSNNPTQLCYELATPTTIQLTGQQIATFLGTNNVWCSSGQIIHLEY